MSITTIYKCDKCGAEQNTPNQFWTVGVVAKHGHDPYQWSDSFTDHKVMQVCRPCLESLGIFVNPREKAPENTPVTIEALIREIINETINSSH